MRGAFKAAGFLRAQVAKDAFAGKLPGQWSCRALFSQMQLPEQSKEGKVLHPDLLNNDLLETKYAVRGEIYLKAEELRQTGKEVTFTNIGNPQALGQSPITFYRQVLALCAAPFLLNHPDVGKLFPSDAIARAKHYVDGIPGGVGAYSDSRGNGLLRKEVAAFIERRDGHPSNPDNIFLTDGASVAVRLCLNALIRSRQDGLLCPIPQYPLYSAGVQLYGGTLVGYELDEAQGWGMSTELLKSCVEKAKKEGVLCRGLVFINPGNPTGQVLTADNLKEVIKFAYDEKLVLMADEVYQENIYAAGSSFVSAKKVLMEMGAPYADNVELLSFHTVSKGMIGECGLRGGYVEMTNIHPGAIDQLYKISSLNLCPNLLGQIVTAMMCNPPQPGDESYEQFYKEKNGTYESMKRRAKMLIDGFNKLDGIECNDTEGAMYAFPSLVLPPKALAAAAADGRSADEFYCLALLADTGIVTVPGCGFGQVEGTYHFRTTILPKEEKMPEVVAKFSDFHKKFMAQYS
ncbi:hypothetical protein CYMTET_28364 [Cymbomonas tetramitiformis]|uniref:Aminotransferase class I/classII large domain-containing protein n=1 Tax=Cymbomonas tetramitiformis TaxID=36881 RepID=A0AAE0FNM5_9CHLO|nr:hypothetical protein CYMTET_28364 [Cymbomonas tetramitiformis]